MLIIMINFVLSYILKNEMNAFRLILTALFAGLISCGGQNKADSNEAQSESPASQSEEIVSNNEDAEVISNVYSKFVFAIETDGKNDPTDYFTAGALKKLQDEYEFDCEDGPCYAFYALRTKEQDSNPDSEDVSQVCSIEPVGDGWYTVSYLDMGWSGMTRIKIVDGKVDDYQRCVADL